MADNDCVSVRLPEQPMDCSFHPTQNLVAAGLITGQVRICEYSNVAATRKCQKKLHSESCRAVTFSSSGNALLTGSADKSLVLLDTATNKVLRTQQDAHPAGLSKVTELADHSFASGDDDGLIRTWDQRQSDATSSFEVHSDFVSDMVYHAGEQCIVAVSGDGTLSVNDLRTSKVRGQSEDDADDELLSVAIMKGDKKLLAGTQSGVINLYSWGHIDDCSDRFPGHPSSVDALVKYDADTVITGSSDGIIRIVNILPNRMLGVLGGDEDLPIERLALSGDHTTLASVSHESCLKLWDLTHLKDSGSDEEEAGQEGAAAQETEQPHQTSVGQQQAEAAGSDSDSDAEPPEKAKKGKRDRGKGQHKVTKRSRGSGAASFFSDLL